MTPDAIEKEILINAPVATVYRVITEPDQIARWFSDAAELDPVPGGAGTLTFEDRATSQRMAVKLVVQAAEPPRRASSPARATRCWWRSPSPPRVRAPGCG